MNPDRQQILRQVYQVRPELNPEDPRSVDYVRANNRNQGVVRELINTLMYSLLLMGLLIYLNANFYLSLLVSIVLVMKKYLIVFIKIYQNIAPDKVRNKCRYEPSCSNYMIASLRKHGVIFGTYNGLRRIMRCSDGVSGGYEEVI